MTTTDAPEVDQLACARLMKAALERVTRTQTENIRRAAGLVVESIQAGGIIQVFGTGHSRSIAMEIAGRAGGLVPANALSIKDLVMYGDVAPSEIHSSAVGHFHVAMASGAVTSVPSRQKLA